MFKSTENGQIAFTDEELAEYNARSQALAAESAKLQEPAYRVKRSIEYPPITDYIDGVVKGDQSQVQAYIDACLAVKAKYPKP